jgi:nitronate monooxygenase
MLEAHDLPTIIQGGMGIGVSDWRLARSVSIQGGLGVVSGTAIDTVLVRRLQLGDEGGHVRRALAAFPDQRAAERLLKRYYVEGGIPPDAPFQPLPLPKQRMNRARLQVFVLANFVEVFLAKEGHDGPIGINYLEKIQLPTLPSLYGALLAGVDVILMGAGIPASIPGIIAGLLAGERVELKLQVEGHRTPEGFTTTFAHEDAFDEDLLAARRDGARSRRPLFLPIISSHILAKTLTKKANGKVDGFVVESHVAGGHNAPPRKSRTSDGGGWGALDAPDLDVLRGLELPFWLAGGRASAAAYQEARRLGAHGIQVGTAFAFCEESGIPLDVKRRTIASCRRGTLHVVTDFEASPTGYPFKLVLDDDEPRALQDLRDRTRVCDLGYLRQNYVDEHGRLGYRCPGEPKDTYVAKGGALEATHNKLCLCNGLLATVGLGQRRDHVPELPIYTAGEGIESILEFLGPGRDSYTAGDVLKHLRAERAPGP